MRIGDSVIAKGSPFLITINATGCTPNNLFKTQNRESIIHQFAEKGVIMSPNTGRLTMADWDVKAFK